VRGAEQVAQVDLLVLVVQDRRLDGALEELVGMPAEELVERVVARRRTRPARGPRRPARPHIWRSEATGAGKVMQIAASERADVDAELERRWS
jgi:hypothetical protein